jgi:hypothetical protein
MEFASEAGGSATFPPVLVCTLMNRSYEGWTVLSLTAAHSGSAPPHVQCLLDEGAAPQQGGLLSRFYQNNGIGDSDSFQVRVTD